MTQLNLGNAYGTLAQVYEREENCELAIASFKNALKVYTHEAYPYMHLNTKRNLGMIQRFCTGSSEN